MTLAELAEGEPFDLVVIGGGINGAGIASEAARAGLRTALVEATDFGFGTTWRSTKLIHGGLRYLEHGDVRLVRESLRERSWLLRTRPHLVRPQRFLLPLVEWTRRPAWQLRAGLAMYDALSYPGALPRHRRLSRGRARETMPALCAAQEGAFAFYDARALAPERLAIEMAVEARDAGAVVLNHTRAVSFESSGGRLTGVRVAGADSEAVLPCKAAVNAAGPWVDELLGGATETLLGVTRGSHIVLKLPEGTAFEGDALFSTARSDGRVFFAVPNDGLLLVGTTDDRFDAPADSVRPTPNDLEYLLAEAGEVLPGLELKREMIRYAYAGLRPLQRVKGGPEAAITRRHELVDHGKRGGPAGLYSVIGGKLSTFRPLAHQVVRTLGASPPRGPVGGLGLATSAETLLAALDPKAREHVSRYGTEVASVLKGGREVVCEHTGAVEGEIDHAVRREMATTLSDVLMRRTGIAWGWCRGLCCAEVVAARMAKQLGWNARARKRQVATFHEDLAYHLPEPAQVHGETAK